MKKYTFKSKVFISFFVFLMSKCSFNELIF